MLSSFLSHNMRLLENLQSFHPFSCVLPGFRTRLLGCNLPSVISTYLTFAIRTSSELSPTRCDSANFRLKRFNEWINYRLLYSVVQLFCGWRLPSRVCMLVLCFPIVYLVWSHGHFCQAIKPTFEPEILGCFPNQLRKALTYFHSLTSPKEVFWVNCGYSWPRFGSLVIFIEVRHLHTLSHNSFTSKANVIDISSLLSITAELTQLFFQLFLVSQDFSRLVAYQVPTQRPSASGMEFSFCFVKKTFISSPNSMSFWVFDIVVALEKLLFLA